MNWKQARSNLATWLNANPRAAWDGLEIDPEGWEAPSFFVAEINNAAGIGGDALEGLADAPAFRIAKADGAVEPVGALAAMDLRAGAGRRVS